METYSGPKRAETRRRLAMVSEIVRQTGLPNESAEYLAKREELRIAELELMRQRERVAEMRRRLPAGAPLTEYVFKEGPEDLDQGDTPVRSVRLTELFTEPDRALIAYQMMYGKKQKEPSPMCTLFVDALNGVAHHLQQTVDVVVIAAAEPEDLRRLARSRGWNRLRFLSCGDSKFKYDMGSEDRVGNQNASLSVFTLDYDGTARHFYSAHPALGPDAKMRGLDLLNPIWNYLDLTPHGRGDFVAKLTYPPKLHAAGR